MNFRTSPTLSEPQIKSGLNFIVKEGLAAEAMSSLTGGAFLVALALHLGATNFQIGLLAALPTFTNLSQLLSIWLVQRYRNRRAISVICSTCARIPLLVIGCLPFIFSAGTSLQVLLFFLFFHYFFGSVSGASWNAWIKDLVPQRVFGSYFSNRTRQIQLVNVTMSLAVAIMLDHIKKNYPQHEFTAYSFMFIVGGLVGMVGVYLLSRAPEPTTTLTSHTNVFKLIRRPLKDKNFRKLLVFHSSWVFALNLAMPFFSVYLMRTLGLPLFYVIALGITAQVSSICSLNFWGRLIDRYSNKTIIAVCAPTFIVCTLAWSFTNSTTIVGVVLLVLVHVVSGATAAGINLGINNIAVKLAPADEAIVYISARNIVIAIFGAIAPLAGGLMADFFATHQLAWTIEWKTPQGITEIPILVLQHWNFFFVIGAVMAFFSLRFLKRIQEEGEVEKREVISYINTRAKTILHRSTNRAYIIRRISSTPLFAPVVKKLTACVYLLRLKKGDFAPLAGAKHYHRITQA